MSSSPNGPPVQYEYMTKTNEMRPAFFAAAETVFLFVGLPTCCTLKLRKNVFAGNVARRVHEASPLVEAIRVQIVCIYNPAF